MSQTELQMLSAGSGTSMDLTADEDMQRGQVCAYTPQQKNTAHTRLAKADHEDTMPAKFISLGAVSAGRRGKFLRRGIMKDTTFTKFSPQTPLYVSQTTPGLLTATRPSTGFRQEVAVALGGGWIDFDPQDVGET